jgi:hypothetical protein
VYTDRCTFSTACSMSWAMSRTPRSELRRSAPRLRGLVDGEQRRHRRTSQVYVEHVSADACGTSALSIETR